MAENTFLSEVTERSASDFSDFSDQLVLEMWMLWIQNTFDFVSTHALSG